MKEMRKDQMDKEERYTLLRILVAFLIVVSIGVVAFLRFYNSYIDASFIKSD